MMDQILKGTLLSDKPQAVKRMLCHKVEELGSSNQPPETVHSVLTVALKTSFEISEPCIIEACKKIYSKWGRNNLAVLERFFTPVMLEDLLDEQAQNQIHAMWYIHETMTIIHSNKPQFLKLCEIMCFESVTYLTRFPSYQTVTGLCRFLSNFHECIPRGGRLVAFCNSLITAAGTFEAPRIAELMRQYIVDVTDVVGGLLSYIWRNSDHTIIVKSLHQVFSLISHVHNDRVPSLALAGIVSHVPTEFMDSTVKQTVSDLSIPDMNIKVALKRMLDWLAWPAAKHLDAWIIAFFQGLASVHKYTILMEVIEAKIENVYEKLHYVTVRESAFAVLSHMLLSYQHSPEPFHKVVQMVPKTIKKWSREHSEMSYSLMCRFSILLHILMSHHLGFPELYEPVIKVIKDLPKPSAAEVKEHLEKCSWKASQKTNFILSVSNTLNRKSETGKTGLINLGNTCYMNSVLQALYMCDSFRKEVLFSSVSQDQPLLSELRRVFAFLLATQRAAYAPSAFHAVSRPPWFVTGLQQDCSEFMRYLYDQMHEQELAKLKSEAMQNKPTDVTASQNSTLISRMFMGKIVTVFKCLACQHESRHVESFTDLSLAFPEDLSMPKSRNVHSATQKAALVGGALSDKAATHNVSTGKDDVLEDDVSLEHLLTHYLKPEKLKDENKYYCDICRGLQDGERTIHITSPPEYLNLTLLRFAYNVKAKTRSKIFTDVAYPRTLHIPIHQMGSVTNKGIGMKDRIKKSKTSENCSADVYSATYALCAVIVHSGYSSDSGHYYCYARHNRLNAVHSVSSSMKWEKHNGSDQDFLPDQWYLFNDSRVTYSRYESFCNITKTFGKDTPYVLFYKRIHPHDDNDRSVESLMDVSLPTDLRTAVDQDNRLFLQEQELAERSKQLQLSNHSSTTYYSNWKDPDDKGPPGSCGGGGGGGFSTNRLVY